MYKQVCQVCLNIIDKVVLNVLKINVQTFHLPRAHHPCVRRGEEISSNLNMLVCLRGQPHPLCKGRIPENISPL